MFCPSLFPVCFTHTFQENFNGTGKSCIIPDIIDATQTNTAKYLPKVTFELIKHKITESITIAVAVAAAAAADAATTIKYVRYQWVERWIILTKDQQRCWCNVSIKKLSIKQSSFRWFETPWRWPFRVYVIESIFVTYDAHVAYIKWSVGLMVNKFGIHLYDCLYERSKCTYQWIWSHLRASWSDSLDHFLKVARIATRRKLQLRL